MSDLEWPCRLVTTGSVCPICASRGDTAADKEHRCAVLEAATERKSK